MPKDTKSLNNNKAPACESRGFVHKKEGVHFDTPSYFFDRSFLRRDDEFAHSKYRLITIIH